MRGFVGGAIFGGVLVLVGFTFTMWQFWVLILAGMVMGWCTFADPS